MAASTIVGHNLGAGFRLRAMRAGWIASAFNAGLMLAIAGAYILAAQPLIAFFNPDPEVIAYGVMYVRLVAWSYAALGVAVVLSNALSGAGDTMASFLIDLIVLYVIQTPLLLWVVVRSGSIPEVFGLMAAGNVLSAIVYAAWYYRGRWMDRRL